MAARIRKDDNVVVITGKDKGRQGRVLRLLPERDRVIVEGVNVVKRHRKPTPKFPQGGIVDEPAPIHLSNVMLYDSKANAPTRVKSGKDKEGKKVRIAVKSGAVVG